MPKNFSTADAKALIAKHEELYQQLIEICDEKRKDFTSKVQRAHNEILSSQIFSDQIIDDLRRGVERIPRTFSTEALAAALCHFREIDILLSKQKNVESRYNDACSSCQHSIDATERTIRKTVDVLLATEALKQLQEYDLETLNQKRSGIRTKPLRNAGYENIADIYSATASNLASINGISEESAYQIKRAASEIFESIRDGIHLKISTDDRSKEATNLIAALYTFKTDKSLLNDFINTLDALVRYSNSYSECLGTLMRNLHYLSVGDSIVI